MNYCRNILLKRRAGGRVWTTAGGGGESERMLRDAVRGRTDGGRLVSDFLCYIIRVPPQLIIIINNIIFNRYTPPPGENDNIIIIERTREYNVRRYTLTYVNT